MELSNQDLFTILQLHQFSENEGVLCATSYKEYERFLEKIKTEIKFRNIEMVHCSYSRHRNLLLDKKEAYFLEDEYFCSKKCYLLREINRKKQREYEEKEAKKKKALEKQLKKYEKFKEADKEYQAMKRVLEEAESEGKTEYEIYLLRQREIAKKVYTEEELQAQELPELETYKRLKIAGFFKEEKKED